MNKIRKFIVTMLVITMVTTVAPIWNISANNTVGKKVTATTKKKKVKRKKKPKAYIKVAKVKVTKKAVKVKVKFVNKTNREKCYGEVYFIKKYVNGKWQKIEYGHGGKMAFNSIAYVLPKKSSAYKTYNLTYAYNKEDLQPGKYRIYVDYDTKSKGRYATFRIKK